MSQIIKKAVLGMALGDGHIDKHNRLSIKHGPKQVEYFFYKLKLLEQFQRAPVWHKPYTAKVKGKEYFHYALATKQMPYYRVVKQWLEKGITRKYLNKLTPHSIAIWFMDDGSTTLLKSVYKREDGTVSEKPRGTTSLLSTFCSKEEAETICNYFREVHGIEPKPANYKGKYVIRFNTKEGKKLGSLIQEYILPCVFYKVAPLLNLQDNAPK
jgi:hypothetical protein